MGAFRVLKVSGWSFSSRVGSTRGFLYSSLTFA